MTWTTINSSAHTMIDTEWQLTHKQYIAFDIIWDFYYKIFGNKKHCIHFKDWGYPSKATQTSCKGHKNRQTKHKSQARKTTSIPLLVGCEAGTCSGGKRFWGPWAKQNGWSAGFHGTPRCQTLQHQSWCPHSQSPVQVNMYNTMNKFCLMVSVLKWNVINSRYLCHNFKKWQPFTF